MEGQEDRMESHPCPWTGWPYSQKHPFFHPNKNTNQHLYRARQAEGVHVRKRYTNKQVKSTASPRLKNPRERSADAAATQMNPGNAALRSRTRRSRARSHVCEMPRTGRSTETGHRQVAARGLGGVRGTGEWLLMGVGLHLGWWDVLGFDGGDGCTTLRRYWKPLDRTCQKGEL